MELELLKIQSAPSRKSNIIETTDFRNLTEADGQTSFLGHSKTPLVDPTALSQKTGHDQIQSVPTQKFEDEIFEQTALDLLKRPDFVVEANFMNIPIFSFDKNGKSKKQDFVSHNITEVFADRSTVVRKVTVAVAQREKNGKGVRDHLPNGFDHDVWLVLMDMWDEQNRPMDGMIYFRVTDICKKLNLTTSSGKNHERIIESIHRLKRTTIESKNAFYNVNAAKHIAHSIGLLDEAMTQATRGRSREKVSVCYVKISKPILENLVNNYTTKINRRLYLQLSHGFSKRISNLVEFLKQRKQIYGKYDFSLRELAEKLPMSGKYYPSKVMERLKHTLAELQEKELYSHETYKVNGEIYIRFTPLRKEDSMVGLHNLTRFLLMSKEVYSKSIPDTLSMTEEDIKRMLAQFDRIIDFGGRQYSWVFHVLSILQYQVTKDQYEIKSSGLIMSMLKKEKMDIPIGFKAIDVKYEEISREKDLQVVSRQQENKEREVIDAFSTIAESYLTKITKEQRKAYEKRIEKDNDSSLFAGLMKEGGPMYNGLLKNLIMDDLKNGTDIKI